MAPAPTLATQVAVLSQRVETLTDTLEAQKQSHNALVDSVNELNRTWNQASGMLRLIQWLAVISAAAAGLIVAVKSHVFHG